MLVYLEKLCVRKGSGCKAQEMFLKLLFASPHPLYQSAWCFLTSSCVMAGNETSDEQGSRQLRSGLAWGAQHAAGAPGLAMSWAASGTAHASPSTAPCSCQLQCKSRALQLHLLCWKSLSNHTLTKIYNLCSVKSAVRALQGGNTSLASQSETWFNQAGCSNVGGKLLGFWSSALLPLVTQCAALAV